MRNPEFRTCETKVTSPLWVQVGPSVAGRGGGSRSAEASLGCVGKQRSVVVMFDVCLRLVWLRCRWQGKCKPGLSPLLLFWFWCEGARYQSLLHLTLVGRWCISSGGRFGDDGDGSLPSSASGPRRLTPLTSSYNLTD